jgi:hypothetical protein
MGLTAFVLGLTVVGVTVLSQVGVGPGDFVVVALFGLGVVVLSVAAFSIERGRPRVMAAAGALLGSAPLALLAYYLVTSDG